MYLFLFLRIQPSTKIYLNHHLNKFTEDFLIKRKEMGGKANIFGFEKDMPLFLFAKEKHYQVHLANNKSKRSMRIERHV